MLIWPYPASVVDDDGELVIEGPAQVFADRPAAEREAHRLVGELNRSGVVAFLADPANKPTPAIELSVEQTDSTAEDGESYRLDVSADGVMLVGGGKAGLAHAVTTLLQLVSQHAGDGAEPTPLRLPAVRIEDRPRFAWRGMHLDIARHFFDVASIKRYVDWLAYHKLNVLHLHLTDDQGWRFESHRFPELTEVGSWRARTDEPRRGEPADESAYGGYLTQDDCREIVAYAEARHVTVVPEIDVPGHAKAVLAAYPQLGCEPGPHEVWTQWGISEDVLCAGRDESLEWLKQVLEEVLEVFPSPCVHVGGDEVPKTRWRSCAACQRRIQAEGLADEEALQGWFISRVGRFLAERGRRMVVSVS